MMNNLEISILSPHNSMVMKEELVCEESIEEALLLLIRDKPELFSVHGNYLVSYKYCSINPNIIFEKSFKVL